MEKRKPEDHQSNGDAGGKRAKMDPDCGTLVFCGSTEWHCANKPGKLREDYFHSKNNVYEPMLVAALKDIRIRHVGSGVDACHCVVVDESGRAWSWGNNEYGQLGQGDNRCRRVPTPVPGTGPDGHVIVMIGLGNRHTVMLTANGDVLACGDNSDGQCGQGEMRTKKNPAKGSEDVEKCNIESIKELKMINFDGPPVIQVSVGSDFTMILDVTGSVWTFGNQEFGQCGTGTDGSYNAANASVKMKYAGISTPFKLISAVERDPKTKKLKSVQMGRVKSMSAGSHHAAVSDENGRVFTWGCGSYGRTGLGDTLDALSPQFVSALDHPRGKVEAVHCGHMMTIMMGTLAGTMFMSGLIDNLKKEANMTPKPYFDIIDNCGPMRDIGFWRKGFAVVNEEGAAVVCSTGSTYGELGFGERTRTQGQPKKVKDLEYAHVLKVGTGSQHVLYVLRDTEEEDKEEMEEFDELDQTAIEYTA